MVIKTWYNGGTSYIHRAHMWLSKRIQYVWPARHIVCRFCKQMWVFFLFFFFFMFLVFNMWFIYRCLYYCTRPFNMIWTVRKYIDWNFSKISLPADLLTKKVYRQFIKWSFFYLEHRIGMLNWFAFLSPSAGSLMVFCVWLFFVIWKESGIESWW